MGIRVVLTKNNCACYKLCGACAQREEIVSSIWEFMLILSTSEPGLTGSWVLEGSNNGEERQAASWCYNNPFPFVPPFISSCLTLVAPNTSTAAACLLTDSGLLLTTPRWATPRWRFPCCRLLTAVLTSAKWRNHQEWTRSRCRWQ